ncbi:MAG: hypothetical protein IKD00_06745 [Candidatus Methanomethylophilaceae archaeon]|nr:hypothetical protein [Candidatus Methanomethylophilaceae archaeon]
MILMTRDSDYPGLLERVRGRRVTVWTCNTCARLCGGIGGSESASRLADALSSDGVDVLGTVSTSASCLMSKAKRCASEVHPDTDLVVALCCDMGALCASRCLGSEVLNPVVTVCPGILSADGTPLLPSGGPLEDPFLGPYR